MGFKIKKMKIAPMQDTSQGFIELKSNAWNKFQEAFPIGQGVWIFAHVIFHVIFKNWWKMANFIKIRFPFHALRPKWNIIMHCQPKIHKFLLFWSIVLCVASCSQPSICKITWESTWIRQTWSYLAYMKYILEHIWIPVLGTPKWCPKPEQFWFFEFDSPTEHSTGHMKKI